MPPNKIDLNPLRRAAMRYRTEGITLLEKPRQSPSEWARAAVCASLYLALVAASTETIRKN